MDIHQDHLIKNWVLNFANFENFYFFSINLSLTNFLVITSSRTKAIRSFISFKRKISVKLKKFTEEIKVRKSILKKPALLIKRVFLTKHTNQFQEL